MEEIVSHHGVEGLLAGLILAFCLHIVWSYYREHSKVTDASIKHVEAKMHKLELNIVELQTKMDQFTRVVASYMENTINLSDKLSEVSLKLDSFKGE